MSTQTNETDTPNFPEEKNGADSWSLLPIAHPRNADTGFFGPRIDLVINVRDVANIAHMLLAVSETKQAKQPSRRPA